MNLKQVNKVREQLLTIFSIALSAVDGQCCTQAYLTTNPTPMKNVRVVSIGKAATGMMLGALDTLAERVRSGLVITKPGHGSDPNDPRVTFIESDHPIPSTRSLFAGEQLIEFVKQVNSDELLLVLISGGTSALVEVLDEAVNLEQMMQLNNWCLSNPYSISQINRLRKSISKIKAGGLFNYIKTKHITQLTISDVRGNDLSVIGSGLLVADDTSNTGEVSVLDTNQGPEWLASLAQKTAKTSNSAVMVQHQIVADNQMAREAILSYAHQQELLVHRNQEIYFELSKAAEAISNTLLAGEPGLYVWGGECVLKLPERPGQGGRCQSLALAIAIRIADENIVVLAAGTDGSDGPGEAAGGLVDGTTIKRGEALGLNSIDELEKANAGYYLSEVGDLIDTGPTHSNVMDLIIALKYAN